MSVATVWLRVVRVLPRPAGARPEEDCCDVACARADTAAQCAVTAKTSGEAYLLRCATLPALCPLVRYLCDLEDEDPQPGGEALADYAASGTKPARRRVALRGGERASPLAAEWVVPLESARQVALGAAWRATRVLCAARGLTTKSFARLDGRAGRFVFDAAVRADAADSALWLDGLHLANSWWARTTWPAWLAWGRAALEEHQPSALQAQLVNLRASPDAFVLRRDALALRPLDDAAAEALGVAAGAEDRAVWEAAARMHAGVAAVWADGHGAAQLAVACREHPRAREGLAWLLARGVAAFDHRGRRLDADQAADRALGASERAPVFLVPPAVAAVEAALKAALPKKIVHAPGGGPRPAPGRLDMLHALTDEELLRLLSGAPSFCEIRGDASVRGAGSTSYMQALVAWAAECDALLEVEKDAACEGATFVDALADTEAPLWAFARAEEALEPHDRAAAWAHHLVLRLSDGQLGVCVSVLSPEGRPALNATPDCSARVRFGPPSLRDKGGWLPSGDATQLPLSAVSRVRARALPLAGASTWPAASLPGLGVRAASGDLAVSGWDGAALRAAARLAGPLALLPVLGARADEAEALARAEAQSPGLPELSSLSVLPAMLLGHMC